MKRRNLRIKKVHSEDHFPEAVDGVITLEENTVYKVESWISTNKIIVGPGVSHNGEGEI